MTHLQDVAYSAADLNPPLPLMIHSVTLAYHLPELAEKREYCHGVRAPHVQELPAHRSVLALDGVLEVVVGLELLRRQGQNLNLYPQRQATTSTHARRQTRLSAGSTACSLCRVYL